LALKWSGGETPLMRTAHQSRPPIPPQSAFAGFRSPPDVIVLAVRWCLRFALSYRDVEELLTERGVEVDHVTIYRWVLRFTPLLAEAARPYRHAVGSRWQVDETYVKVAGRWRYVFRAIDQLGQVIDVFVSAQRDGRAARRFFEHASGTTKARPMEVVTDLVPVYPATLEELLPAAWHRTDRYGNNRLEADHGRLKARAASHARAQAGPQRQDRDCRAWLRGESATRPRRARGRGAGGSARGGCVRRAFLGDLIPRPAMASACTRRPDATAPLKAPSGWGRLPGCSRRGWRVPVPVRGPVSKGGRPLVGHDGAAAKPSQDAPARQYA
jgi:transposase-like protein